MVLLLLLGGSMGSFLNVVVDRGSRGVSIVRPGSQCPNCGLRLRFGRENLPLLGWLLLRHGWVLRDAQQVQVTGAWGFSRDQIIQAAGLRFPVPLLQLNPDDLLLRLAGSLPVEQIQLRRQMLPPQLNISLRQCQAVARAQRRQATGLENGFVDRTGAWISREQQAKARSAAERTVGSSRGARAMMA